MSQCPQFRRDYGELDAGDKGKMGKKSLDPSEYALKLMSTEVLIDKDRI